MLLDAVVLVGHGCGRMHVSFPAALLLPLSLIGSRYADVLPLEFKSCHGMIAPIVLALKSTSKHKRIRFTLRCLTLTAFVNVDEERNVEMPDPGPSKLCASAVCGKGA